MLSVPDVSSPAVAAARAARGGPLGLDLSAAGLQPGDGHPERRAGHIVQARVVEEVHRVRVATVLAADADLEARPCGPALFDGDADQPAHPVPVDRLERRHPEDAELDVAAEER